MTTPAGRTGIVGTCTLCSSKFPEPDAAIVCVEHRFLLCRVGLCVGTDQTPIFCILLARLYSRTMLSRPVFCPLTTPPVIRLSLTSSVVVISLLSIMSMQSLCTISVRMVVLSEGSVLISWRLRTACLIPNLVVVAAMWWVLLLVHSTHCYIGSATGASCS